jgi:1-aminocyclopropane-1-carboxylate deaminase/D-cysteine desulfhydrase-like pyridoxal-dependent ACC family enzyme
MQVTEVVNCKNLLSLFDLDIDLYLKRDDLYPFCGGGSKARKMQYIMRDIEAAGNDVIVTNGGPQSNHARAAALMAADKGMPCHLVIVMEPGIPYPITGNLLLMKMSGATIEYCTKDQLGKRMDCAIEAYKKMGCNPAYIWGGGHFHAGTVAFVEAAEEARSQCGDWIPDFVVHASGTGTTQAGLAIGYADLPTRVIGISVARDAARGAQVVRDTITDYFEKTGGPRKDILVDFRDDWTCGGYEQTNSELLSVVMTAAKTGFMVDPTYSGKALYGLIKLMKRGDIPTGSRVLFWHTGSLLNLMASSLAQGFVSL